MEASIEAQTPQDLAAEGGKYYQSGEFQRAATSFAAAEKSYLLQEDQLNAAEMANNRSVALLQAGQAQAALAAVDGTLEVFSSHSDGMRLAMAYGNQAAALEALQQYDQALEAYQASAELFKELRADELRLDVMKSISALQMKTGRSLEALATMRSGVDGIEKPKLKHRLLRSLLRMPFKLLNRS